MKIRHEIAASGPISFARFMERCLYTPGLGYYSAGRLKFGEHGDFVTAPELGEPVCALHRARDGTGTARLRR